MNRSLRCLSLACLALALFGCEPPTTCKDGDCVDPPKACDQLGEAECLARADCAATYVEADCAPKADCGGRAFVSCAARQQCPVIDCAPLDCPYGLARDAKGCTLCACSPVPCTSNAECPAGQVCLFPALKCEPGATCAPPRGTCGVVEQGCDADADCAAGERCVFPTAPTCPPDAFCSPPRGTCKPAQGCATDADCGLGRFCERRVGTGSDFAPCEAPGCPPPAGTCRERTACTSAADCAVGQVCAMDPSDPCSKNACPMYLPAQLFCLPACPALDEAACLARNDCEAMWLPAPGGQDKRAGFAGCKPQGCPPVVCAMWCPNGFARDASGCEICSCASARCSSDADCRPGQVCVFGGAAEKDCAGEDCGVAPAGTCRDVQQGCQTDAECAPTERCEVPVYDACLPGEACPPLFGRCVPRTCTSDAECLPGQTCVWAGGAETDCAQADCRFAAGTCQVVEKGCQVDAECAPTERCEVAVYDVCPPGEVCPPLYGRCVPRTCLQDGDCLAGQRCAVPDVYCPPDTYCAQPLGVCVTASCRADVECRPGEVCMFAVDACPPGDPACPNVGVCTPAATTCTDDSQCAPGLRCSADPMTNCGPATNCVGQCVPNVCVLDTDCRGNERCLLADCAPGADCMGGGFCVTLPACHTNADCAAGQSCLPDPTDLCNDPAALCDRPGRQICK